MIRITALLPGKHAITVVDVIISQPYVPVESIEVLALLRASRLLIKRSALATIQMKYTWLATLQLSRSMTNNWELLALSARHWCTVQHHSSTAVQESC